ncbi:MAG TPA: hypothetical protein VFX02_09045 [Gammaproteobacteria bacterium]|nr:hypothetical protein [Gammaproteobacteria bacterium]
MKIEISFVSPVENTIARLVLGCAAAGLALLILALAICWSWLRLRAEIPELRQQASELQRRQADFDVAARTLKNAAELNDIRRRIGELNGLAPGGRDISELLAALENVMPAGAVLKSMRYSGDQDEAVLEVESTDAAFLPALEKGNPFPRLTLLKQSKPERGAAMLYEIRLSGGTDEPDV